jgi:hypothetical protein
LGLVDSELHPVVLLEALLAEHTPAMVVAMVEMVVLEAIMVAPGGPGLAVVPADIVEQAEQVGMVVGAATVLMEMVVVVEGAQARGLMVE